MNAHTPGPWHIIPKGPLGAHLWVDAGNESESVARIEPGPEQEANARLIAAAPELLEALQALADRMAILAANGRPPAINELELIKAVEAIAKAKSGVGA